MNRSIFGTALLVAMAFLSGCATGPRPLETPSGPSTADATGPFTVIGVISRATSTLNRPNANPYFAEDVLVQVPTGTELIVPAVRGWRLGFGSLEPADLSVNPAPETSWNADDHYFGSALVNVYVKDVNAPDASGSQSATVTVQIALHDINGDDPWWGLVNYSLICLKRESR